MSGPHISLNKLNPQQLAALIESSMQNRDYPLAEQACMKLKQLRPDVPLSYWILAQICGARGDHKQRLHYLRICVSLKPQQREFRFALAQTYRADGDVENAIEQLDELIRQKPDCTDTHIEKADLLEYSSRYGESEAVITGMVAAGINNPRLTLVQANLALHQGRYEEVIKITKPAQETETLDASQRATQLFLCGQAYDKLSDAANAIEVLNLANQLHHAPFDREAYKEDVDRTLKFFTKERLDLCQQTNVSDVPIFIATMPRSGSTLLDQMIQSHPQASGAGEVGYFITFRKWLMQADRLNYPVGIASMTNEELAQLATGYLDRVETVQEYNTLRVSDKSIENHREYGLISMLFPNAHMIHLRRNALDCCLSMYMHQFNGSLLPQTCSLRNIGFFYQQHNRCMQHWKENVGLSILEVSYEDLVANPECELRRILDFCGLPWDEDCLNFHYSGRLVKTMSYHQVSKPLYNSSIGKGEKYRPYIGELLEELEDTT